MELKIPEVSVLLPTNTFNSNFSDLQTKTKTAQSNPNLSNLATKTEVAHAVNKIPDSKVFVKKTDYATEISSIKNNYVTPTELASQLNDLKSQHIADDVKKVDDKVSKNGNDILSFESRLKQKEDSESTVQSFYGDQYYSNSWLIFKAVLSCFKMKIY